MTTSTGSAPRATSVIDEAKVPPSVAEALADRTRVRDRQPHRSPNADDQVRAARDDLALDLRGCVEAADVVRADLEVAAILTVALAVIPPHPLDPSRRSATESWLRSERLGWYLDPARRQRLGPEVDELLADARDGSALADGEGTFVRTIRRLLHERTDTHARTQVLDVRRSGAMTLGESSLWHVGGSTRRRLNLTNTHGKFLLLVACKRSPDLASCGKIVVSRVKQAVDNATGGNVQLVRVGNTFELRPPVELSGRADEAAALVRSLHGDHEYPEWLARSQRRRSDESGAAPAASAGDQKLPGRRHARATPPRRGMQR